MVAAAQWREGRRYLDQHRHELAAWAARTLYPDHPRAADTGLLARPEWVPTAPVPLTDVRLRWRRSTSVPPVDGSEPESKSVRPLRYATYADAIRDLAPPRLFEDRPCYRLVDVSVAPDRVDLSFGTGRSVSSNLRPQP